ncbi:MAG: GNAT family N-acetyltransferase [Rhodomicrobium sp.]|jgi:GNAT superfamily N-acetyltransferase
MSPPDLRSIRFEQYNSSHFASVRNLFERVWGESRSAEYDDKYWNKTLTGVCPAIVAFFHEQAVGFYMVWPVMLTDGQADFVCGQPIDSMVHPDFQGKGLLRELGNRCYEICSQEGIAVMYGAPNKAAYAGNVGALNWCHVSNLTDWIRPMFGLRGQSSLWVEQDGRWVMHGRQGESTIFTAERDSGEQLSELWTEGPTIRRRWQVSRTQAWMNYRYRSVPEAEYFTVTLRVGEIQAAAAICGFRKVGSRLRATLADLVYKDEIACRLVLKALVNFAKRKGARFMLAKTAPFSLGEQLYRSGFLPVRQTPLISRTPGWQCFAANALSRKGWSLFGGAFDVI